MTILPPINQSHRNANGSRYGIVTEITYQIRVPVLLFLFFLAMVENNRHPFPIWAIALQFISGENGDITLRERHLALLLPLGLYILSLTIRLSATATLGRQTVWAKSPITTSLVQSDLFAHFRHPLYTGSAGMILSLSLMSSPYGAIILIGAGLPFLIFLARHEERGLQIKFPEYSTYRMHVPAFLPTRSSLREVWKALIKPLRKRLGSSIRSEAFNMALLGGFVTFWITPRLSLFWISFLTALCLSFSAPLWLPEEKEEAS